MDWELESISDGLICYSKDNKRVVFDTEDKAIHVTCNNTNCYNSNKQIILSFTPSFALDDINWLINKIEELFKEED